MYVSNYNTLNMVGGHYNADHIRSLTYIPVAWLILIFTANIILDEAHIV